MLARPTGAIRSEILTKERRRAGRMVVSNPHLVALLRTCGEIGRSGAGAPEVETPALVANQNGGRRDDSISLLDGACQVGMPYRPDGPPGSEGEPPPFLNNQACYLASQLVATPDGVCMVGSLAVGDVVLTQCGRRRIVWLQSFELHPTAEPQARRGAPVRIRADAISAGLPRIDLLVSPSHCLWIAGCLVPARLLVDGVTIVQETSAPVRYCHLLFDRPAHGQLISTASQVALLRDSLARGFGYTAMQVMLDGRQLNAIEAGDTWQAFVIPAGVQHIQLLAPSAIAVARIDIETTTDRLVIPADHPGLVHGWEPCQQDHQMIWRTMRGGADLPLSSLDGPARMTVHLVPALPRA
jgi:hypothetical protein